MKTLTPRMIVLDIARCSHDQQRTLTAMEHYLARGQMKQVDLLRDWYEELEDDLKRWRQELDLLGEMPIRREVTS